VAMFTEVLMFFAARGDGAAGHGSDRFDACEGVGIARPAAAPRTGRAGNLRKKVQRWQQESGR